MTEQQIGSGKAQCAWCTQEFAHDELVFVDNKWVCASCKPMCLRMMQEGLSSADMTVARDKKILVMGKNAQMPHRCVKCNGPANAAKRLKSDISWHSPFLYLLIFAGLLVYIVAAVIVRKKATIEIPLCNEHAGKRRRQIMVAWLVGLGSLGLLFSALPLESGLVALIGAMAFLGNLIYVAAALPVVSVQRIDDDYIRLKGVCQTYLDALPEWRKPR